MTAGPVSGAPSEVAQPSDGRASLLESIRNAGGIGKAKLRNVKERKMEKKKQKEQEQGRGAVASTALGKSHGAKIDCEAVFLSQQWQLQLAAGTSCLISSINLPCEGKVMDPCFLFFF